MPYYLVEIKKQKRSCGEHVLKAVFENETKARCYIDDYLEQDWTQVQDITKDVRKYDDEGPNWERLLVLVVDFVINKKKDFYVITLDKIF